MSTDLIRTLRAAADRQLTPAETAVVLRAATSPRGRDVILAVVTGHEADAARLAAGQPSATSWVIDGPLDGNVIDRYTPVLYRLYVVATGTRAAVSLSTLLGYLDWAEARYLAAAGRLTGPDSTDGLRTMIKRLMATGQIRPRVVRAASLKSVELARSL